VALVIQSVRPNGTDWDFEKLKRKKPTSWAFHLITHAGVLVGTKYVMPKAPV
jgi:hypothetical protein